MFVETPTSRDPTSIVEPAEGKCCGENANADENGLKETLPLVEILYARGLPDSSPMMPFAIMLRFPPGVPGIFLNWLAADVLDSPTRCSPASITVFPLRVSSMSPPMVIPADKLFDRGAKEVRPNILIPELFPDARITISPKDPTRGPTMEPY